MGSFVPADSATLHVFDNVHTRMGASDSIQRGRSTFLEELSEAGAILRGASARSLVIMDELGRGTSTMDGVAIAYATLHSLLAEQRALTLFVTHYPQIAELRKEFPSEVGTYFVSFLAEEASQRVPRGGSGGDADAATGKSDRGQATRAEEADQKVTFLYKLVPGLSPRSFGLHVARLAEVRGVDFLSGDGAVLIRIGGLWRRRLQFFGAGVQVAVKYFVISVKTKMLLSLKTSG